MNTIYIMEYEYKGYIIKVRWGADMITIHYHVWTLSGRSYFGRYWTGVQAQEKIDAFEREEVADENETCKGV